MKKICAIVLAICTFVVSYTNVMAEGEMTNINIDGTTLQNVAVNKYVWASSYRATKNEAPCKMGASGEHLSYFPANVVTGMVEGYKPWKSMEADAVAGLQQDKNPWIAIDLGTPYRIEYVDLYTVADIGGEVLISGSLSKTANTITDNVAIDNGKLENEVALGSVTLDLSGKYTRVYIDNGSKFQYIKFARPEGDEAVLGFNQICVYAQDVANSINLSNGKAFRVANYGTPSSLAGPADDLMGLTDKLFPTAQSNDNGWYCANFPNNRGTIDLGGEFIVDRIDITSQSNPWETGHSAPFFRMFYDVLGGNTLTDDGHLAKGSDSPDIDVFPNYEKTPGTNILISQQTYTGPAGGTISHKITDKTPFRYITYRKNSKNNVLHIAEITVFGHKADSVSKPIENVALGKAINENTVDLGGVYSIKKISALGENLDECSVYGSLEPNAPRNKQLLLCDGGVCDVTANNFTRYITIQSKTGKPATKVSSISAFAEVDSGLLDYTPSVKVDGKFANIVDGKLDTDYKTDGTNSGVTFTIDTRLPLGIAGFSLVMSQKEDLLPVSRTNFNVYGSEDGVTFKLVQNTAKQDVGNGDTLNFAFSDNCKFKYLKLVPKEGEFVGIMRNYPDFGGNPYTTGISAIAEARIFIKKSEEPIDVAVTFNKATNTASYIFKNFTASPKTYNYIMVATDENNMICGNWKAEGSGNIVVEPMGFVSGNAELKGETLLPPNYKLKFYIWDSLSQMNVLDLHKVD